MRLNLPKLPVTEVLPDIERALQNSGKAVLVAPPGAGKTTLVPLYLLDATWMGDGKIILLEPRRLAARAAARRMASILGEEVGQTVGYRMRLESRISAKTRILVVTEGVFARMILDDPELSGINAVFFDEFHERSLDADFGLALALDVHQGLRPDLRLLIMSATLDGSRIASHLDGAPVIESQGRAFPVEIVYEPRKADQRLEEAMASAIKSWLAREDGSILAFLPGQNEIKRTVELLANRLPENTILAPLFGAMEGHAQDIAIRPAETGKRKIVLATSIAESSLTIDGVRIVIDSGLSRVPVFEPATGVTRLTTIRSSRASTDQRAGRAGRTTAGIAVRLWHEGQTAALPQFSQPEILSADLSNLVLDSAAFGVSNVDDLTFLDPPPLPALNEARALLIRLGALDGDGRITAIGKAMREKALPVRLAAMLIKAEETGEAALAAEIAVILTERGLGGADIDIERRIENFRKDRSDRGQKARGLARRLGGETARASPHDAARLLLAAWPDRVAKTRGTHGRFVLANGRGVVVDDLSPLAKSRYLVVADMSGSAEQARILAAADIDEDTIRSVLKDDIACRVALQFDPTSRSLRARELQTLGALTLSEKTRPPPQGDEADLAIIDAIKQYGIELLPWSKEAQTLRHRLQWLHRGLGTPWPDMSDANLLNELENWLLPFLKGDARLDSINSHTLQQALISLVPYAQQRDINQKAPTHYVVPTGSNIAIRYDGEAPILSVRVQELFGLSEHPAIADGTVPLLLELLSPAHRPIQITRDLPGFWSGSWADIRADMRGRYPKHPWPENPLLADPTRRTKPRGS